MIDLKPYALISKQHPLARNTSVDLDDLFQLPLIMLEDPSYEDFIDGLYRRLKRHPKVAHRVTNYEMTVGLVATGAGYAILNVRSQLDGDDGNLAHLSIKDNMPVSQLVLATLNSMRSESIQGFVDVAVERIKAFDPVNYRWSKDAISLPRRSEPG